MIVYHFLNIESKCVSVLVIVMALFNPLVACQKNSGHKETIELVSVKAKSLGLKSRCRVSKAAKSKSSNTCRSDSVIAFLPYHQSSILIYLYISFIFPKFLSIIKLESNRIKTTMLLIFQDMFRTNFILYSYVLMGSLLFGR